MGDHARWILLVMVAGLVPLGLGAVLLIRASDQSARRYQAARMSSVASTGVERHAAMAEHPEG